MPVQDHATFAAGDVLLRGGTRGGTVHHASTSYETWGLTRVPAHVPPEWELYERCCDDLVDGLHVWDFVRTLDEHEVRQGEN